MVFKTIIGKLGRDIDRNSADRDAWEELFRQWNRAGMLPEDFEHNQTLYRLVKEDNKFAPMLLETSNLEASDDTQIYRFWEVMDRLNMVDGKPHDALTGLPIHARLDGIEMHLVPTGVYQLDRTKILSPDIPNRCYMAMPFTHDEIVYLSQPILQKMLTGKGADPAKVTLEEAERYARTQKAELPPYEVLDIAINATRAVSVMSPIGTLSNPQVPEWTTNRVGNRIVSPYLRRDQGMLLDTLRHSDPNERQNFRLMKRLGLKGETPEYNMMTIVRRFDGA